MTRLHYLKSALVGGASVLAIAQPATAREFDIPQGDLIAALDAYSAQSGVQIIYSDDAIKGRRTKGAKGDLSELAALNQVLSGTGFTVQTMPSNEIGIVPQDKPKPTVKLAQAQRKPAAAPPSQSGVETVVVTAQKKSEDIQQVPIAVSAFSQKDLTERQIAGGPDLVKEVPNLTFSKTNFSGYNLEIRGIGTQAISVTTDPAVAVAFNDIPFIRNHFFEQEFYDLQDAEVLRGPQGTLYGRNATAGVVNIKSALPTDQYEAMMSADLGNYSNRRLEGMLNIPIVGDTLDIRFAGEWTKRDGYTEDTTLDTAVDGRDLWSGRMTIGWKPSSDIQTYFVWEHFSEDDDRLRSGKQLCKTDYGPNFVATPNLAPQEIGYDVVGGQQKPIGNSNLGTAGDYFIQGCSPDVSLYSSQADEAPIGYALPYVLGLEDINRALGINPYSDTVQSPNLRDIQSSILPHYVAKNDTLEFNATWAISPTITFMSQTGYNNDFLFSSEDFNRFGSTPGLFSYEPGDTTEYGVVADPSGLQICQDYNGCGTNNSIQYGNPCLTKGATLGPGCQLAGYFCDPQVGCSDALVAEDLSEERAWQFSQEFRFSSNFSGPFNFTAGGNYLHYETVEYYYVFSNALTLINYNAHFAYPPYRFQYDTPNEIDQVSQGYIDPNPISNLNNEGHNYFLSQNPYVLNSYAVFGDTNYDITNELKLITGLRWTDDQKHFLDIPSWVATEGYGYPVMGIVDQSWERFTGRAVLNWTPQLDFTDQTLVYGSYAHGYKAGGANPPGAVFNAQFDGVNVSPVHPLTFKPEYIEAFELGTKNTLLDGALTVNADIFYYNYTGYQISEIVDRTAINTNYNANVEGAELETNWEPAPGLKFGFNGGYENSGLAGGDAAVDLMDRTAGHSDWVVVKPFPTEATSCIFPVSVAQYMASGAPTAGVFVSSYCSLAYVNHLDPITLLPYVPNPTLQGAYITNGGTRPCCVDSNGNPITGYSGFNPLTAPNNGAGFSKNLAGNQLPNAPHFTTSLTAEYTIPVSDDWAATFHTDLYWQSQQWARVFEDPIDKIHGYSNVNVALTLTSANGWEVMAYVKNLFDVTAITGTFLNSDDTGLTTNVFLTDPRLIGVRVTKHLDDNDGFWGADYNGGEIFKDLFADSDNGKPTLWVQLGGQFSMLDDVQEPFIPPFFSAIEKQFGSPVSVEHTPRSSLDYTASLEYQPDGSDWSATASVTYGRTHSKNHLHQQTNPGTPTGSCCHGIRFSAHPDARYVDAFDSSDEGHAIFDFSVGKDVGLGALGLQGDGKISVGVRAAQFSQSSSFRIHSDPDYVFHLKGPKYTTDYGATESSKRSFHGIGPSISWKASESVSGAKDANGIDFDWGFNAAVLFGRQRTQISHQSHSTYYCVPELNGGCRSYGTGTASVHSASGYVKHNQGTNVNLNRSRMIAVPNVGAFAGLSWNYQNAKVSFGYKVDEFFGAMDGGIDSRKSENVGFSGPYANITIGIGG